MSDEKIIEVASVPENLSVVVRSEIDMQITTAKSYPRSITKFMEDLLSMATLSPEIAEDCGYALKRNSLNTETGQWETKIIDGPGIRLAEMAALSYENLRAGSRIISNDGKTITAQGVCHDLERNVCITIEIQRSILNKHGKSFTQDMQVVTGNAAASIALRNAIFKVIPKTIINHIYNETKRVALGTVETLVARRSAAIKVFKEEGVKESDIYRVLEVKGLDDIDIEKLRILRGMWSAFKNENVPMSEIFPPEEVKPTAGGKGSKDKADKAVQQTLDMMADKKGANGQ